MSGRPPCGTPVGRALPGRTANPALRGVAQCGTPSRSEQVLHQRPTVPEPFRFFQHLWFLMPIRKTIVPPHSIPAHRAKGPDVSTGPSLIFASPVNYFDVIAQCPSKPCHFTHPIAASTICNSSRLLNKPASDIVTIYDPSRRPLRPYIRPPIHLTDVLQLSSSFLLGLLLSSILRCNMDHNRFIIISNISLA